MAYETLVVVVTAASIAILLFVGSVVLFRGQLQDVYIRLRGPAPVSSEVALVTVGPESLYLYNPADPAPDVTPRALLAEIVRFLDAADASVVVLDFLLDRPDADDALLAEAAAAHGAVLSAERFEVTEPSSGRVFTPGIPPTLDAAMGSGFANFQEEPSSWLGNELLVRRLPLLHTTDRAHLEGQWPMNQVGSKQDIDSITPALSLAAARLHRSLQSNEPVQHDAFLAELQRRCTPLPLNCEFTASELGLADTPLDLSLPHDINFRGPEGGDGLVTVDAARILRVLAEAALMRQLGQPGDVRVPQDLAQQLAGRVVVVGRVGVTDSGFSDRFATPYSLPVQDRADMSGPRIHAHVIDTLLTGRHIRHAGALWSWLMAPFVAGVIWVTGQRFAATAHAGVVLGITAIGVTAGFVLFRFTDGLVLDVGPSVAAAVGTAIAVHLRGWSREQVGLSPHGSGSGTH